MNSHSVAVEDLLAHHKEQVLSEWQAELRSTGSARDPHSENRETSELLEALLAGLRATGSMTDLDAAGWSRLRDLLARLSASRAAQGATAADTSRFVLALKKPLFSGMQRAFSGQPDLLLAATWEVSTLLDAMAQHTVSTHQRTREDIIIRQQQDLLELSTPVVKLWEGVLAVPMIGTLDSGRTQIVMEALLERIVQTGSALAIIDITGVPTVDTLVAQHLMKTVTAIRLMGADCIISGIRPQIAQTIVHLGIDLEGITTKATLADALSLALRRTGYVITRNRAAAEVVSGRMD